MLDKGSRIHSSNPLRIFKFRRINKIHRLKKSSFERPVIFPNTLTLNLFQRMFISKTYTSRPNLKIRFHLQFFIAFLKPSSAFIRRSLLLWWKQFSTSNTFSTAHSF